MNIFSTFRSKWSLLFSNQQGRNSVLTQIKVIMKSIDIELANRLMSLIYELYLDANYRERTNFQMREMVINLQSQV